MNRLILSAAAVALIGAAGEAVARDQIRIVGSSTVFPFTTAVAEQFGSKTDYPTPVVESTGTGGGMQLFCQGVGADNPDFTNASRAIQMSEFEMCQENGVEDITQLKVGYDGIVLANDQAAADANFTLEQLYQALAAEVPVDGEIQENPYQNWSEIDDSLPDAQIEVLGPPPTSGTRDAFVELVMEAGCESFDAVTSLDEDRMEEVCATMREDGAFVEAGENDNLIVQKLQANQNAYGIFGFSYLDQNRNVIKGAEINDVEPTFEQILTGEYPVSRSLFVYIKNAHVGVIPGMREFIAEYTSEQAMGRDGYLADRGLIPLPDDELEDMRAKASNLVPLEEGEVEG